MPDDNSEEYYLNRERRERTLADAAIDRSIAAIHAAMAVRYSDLAEQVAEKPRRLLVPETA